MKFLKSSHLASQLLLTRSRDVDDAKRCEGLSACRGVVLRLFLGLLGFAQDHLFPSEKELFLGHQF